MPLLQHRPCIKSGSIEGTSVKCPPVCKDSPLSAQIGKKLEEIHGHFIWVFDKLLDDPELVFAVASALVEGQSVARHTLVDPTSPVVARYVCDARNSRAILAS
jgi:hypothetical protein